MKRWGKAAGIVLAATMAAGLAACQSGGGKEKETTGAPPSGSAAAGPSGLEAAQDYAFGEGTTFHANEPVTYSMMYSDHQRSLCKDGERYFRPNEKHPRLLSRAGKESRTAVGASCQSSVPCRI
ncbi:hypothetical protein [Cohnella nanjingensis]|uniref:hypothetical protein n=1 Tax=Cohnella nanjingensis TaxID=1387779 RepID=UPI001FEC74F8|nr:hypothetical protein [Cohnella nanjingensis]